jgi:ribosomal protein L21
VQLILKKVLVLGSKNETMIGRPILVDAAVHAVVEEHVRYLSPKVVSVISSLESCIMHRNKSFISEENLRKCSCMTEKNILQACP